MATAIKCVWCDKPLLDVEHAKKHVAEQCEVAPWRKQIEGLRAESSRMVAELGAAQKRIERLKRLADSGSYVPWESAGGLNECKHGYSCVLSCPGCDREAERNVAD